MNRSYRAVISIYERGAYFKDESFKKVYKNALSEAKLLAKMRTRSILIEIEENAESIVYIAVGKAGYTIDRAGSVLEVERRG